ncbi:MAG: DUF6051 family protein [Bacteroidota bacterium]
MNLSFLNNYYFQRFREWIPRIRGNEYPIDIVNMPFQSSFSLPGLQPGVDDEASRLIGVPVVKTPFEDNNHFNYTIFMPRKKKKHSSAILLMHGLNEKNWKKYFPWAHTLTENLGRPVILFPMAYHINRAPGDWSQPRQMQVLSQWRLSHKADLHESSFINAALSYRMSSFPQQFSISGYQSALDIVSLMEEIRTGRHPYFTEDAHIDIFAYSIGAFLAQILLIANPGDLFSRPDVFLFCGGSAFADMNGSSRLIMDSQAFEKLYNFYTRELQDELERNPDYASLLNGTRLGIAFQSMLGENSHKGIREEVFDQLTPRVKTIALAKDRVIPADKIAQTLKGIDGHRPMDVQILDFPYDYCHENPFPSGKDADAEAVNRSFLEVFGAASTFLGRSNGRC